MYHLGQLPKKTSTTVRHLMELLITAERFGLRSISIGTLERLTEERGQFDPLGAAIREKKAQLEEGSFW